MWLRRRRRPWEWDPQDDPDFGGTLDLGIAFPESMLGATNHFTVFFEDFTTIARTGCDSEWWDATTGLWTTRPAAVDSLPDHRAETDTTPPDVTDRAND